ncbi:uncharacterized protein RHOBADRAFT_52905 [Rhodotorula graminis WP1]|uniref:Proteophosphoglycan ppg4 n=1 Tax=Rhodotorula graminis (strain WP1) TaxID=578459 RepID=A0A194S5V9_RHOGW|nr:uncharacterized protein RHOBADRAFT_52905 [Rhodotorula graminis WP1]KPV75890.1 hypothetical protein RHOBADRAFT_52905 [Rhodotorula graminis WP1]
MSRPSGLAGMSDLPASQARDEASTRAWQIADSLSKLEGRSTGPPVLGDVTLASVELESGEVGGAPSTSPQPRARTTRARTSSSNRASVATLDSMSTTGETVYEDAKEDLYADEPADEVLPVLHLSELTEPPVLFGVPSFAAAGPVAPVSTAELQHSPVDRHAFSPRSAFEEQAILLRRRASLQAQSEASRRVKARLSLSTRSSDERPAHAASRRHSALPASVQVPLATRRTSVAGAAPTSSPPRPSGHLKPLVLTPTRTVQAPLTSLSPTSPTTRRGSADLPRRGSFGLVRQSSKEPDGARSSPGARRLSSPRTPGNRRSLGYFDSASSGHALGAHRDSLAPSPSPPLHVRRGRTASQDTAATSSTDDSALSRSSSLPLPDSPASSVEGWSDEKHARMASAADAAAVGPRGSPLLSDGEWEREYQRRSSRSGPLEMVAEDSATEQSAALYSLGPAIDFTAATPSTIHAASSPSTITSPHAGRPKSKYDEHWLGDAVTDSAAEESDAAPCGSRSSTDSPASLERANSSSLKKGRPIVIKSVTARSSAINARRSQRLSQIDPPVGEASHRLSRAMRRTSSTTGATTHSSTPRTPPSAQLDRSTSHQRRLSTARAPASPGQPLAGLAIWPPPVETKTVSLAPALGYASDAESAAGLSARVSETDDEAFGARAASRSQRRTIGHRRPSLLPRGPRAAPEDDEFGPESWLDVLLTEEPPTRTARSRSAVDLGVDSHAGRFTTLHQYDRPRKGSAPTPGCLPSSSLPVPPRAGGLTKKFLGGFISKAPETAKKPISIAPKDGSRRSSLKPRPVVSGPLELEAASSALARERSSRSVHSLDFGVAGGAASSTRSSSAMSNRVGGRPMVHYPSAAVAAYVRQGQATDDSREELASLHFDSTDDLGASLDAVFRRSPKHDHRRSRSGSPPPVPSKSGSPQRHKRYSSVGSIESLSSSASFTSASSPAGDRTRSRQGSISLSFSSGSLAFPGPSHAVKMERQASSERARDAWRAQVVER